MAAMTAVYCDGWDDAVVHPITRSVAEEGDAAGEAYSVVLLAEGRPHAVLNIWWAEAFCGVDRYDETGRLISRHEYRHTRDGDLFLREPRPGSLRDVRLTSHFHRAGERPEHDGSRGMARRCASARPHRSSGGARRARQPAPARRPPGRWCLHGV